MDDGWFIGGLACWLVGRFGLKVSELVCEILAIDVLHSFQYRNVKRSGIPDACFLQHISSVAWKNRRGQKCTHHKIKDFPFRKNKKSRHSTKKMQTGVLDKPFSFATCFLCCCRPVTDTDMAAFAVSAASRGRPAGEYER